MDTTQRSVREEIARRMLRTTRIGPTAVARYVDLPRDEVVQLAIEGRGGSRVPPSPLRKPCFPFPTQEPGAQCAPGS